MTMITLLTGLGANASDTDSLMLMRGFPTDEVGIEHGVSACYAGSIDNQLIMAGGCNFPVNTLAPDSKKVYYSGIYATRTDEGDQLCWKQIGSLPEPLAYGVAITCDNSMVIIGGMNNDGSCGKVYHVSLVDGKAQLSTLPSLPCTADNMTGALVGRHLYVAGGVMDGKASNRVLRLDLDNLSAGWKDVKPFPGIVRVQPVAGSMGEKRFCLFGGFAPAANGEEAKLAIDGCIYDETTDEWQLLEEPKDDKGEPLFVGGGTAINLNEDQFLVMGGVNKDVFLSAVNHPQPDYLSHPIEWYRFNPYTLLYSKEGWKVLCKSHETARAGAALAQTQHGLYVIGGELKPRVRSNKIVKYPKR
ncbi:MAG: cyclically-permuted mutarotase family protein [Prevotella fusca]|uniref:cyclically-permuted mutarotase family protein n=1 Tax=Prevotella fusca TaxID=589436 RepID=UPI003F9F3370